MDARVQLLTRRNGAKDYAWTLQRIGHPDTIIHKAQRMPGFNNPQGAGVPECNYSQGATDVKNYADLTLKQNAQSIIHKAEPMPRLSLVLLSNKGTDR